MRFRWLPSLAVAFPLALTTMAAAPVRAQCTPVNCLATLPPQGGLCASSFPQATLGAAYADAVSFHTTTSCFDAGEISPPNAGTTVRINSTHDYTFSGLPAGVTAATNQASYASPANGCISLSGTPSEAGVFDVQVNLLADLTVTTSSCFAILAQNNNAVSYAVRLTVPPDASFSIPATTFTACQAPVTLTPTGTQGGTFSGPGVSGSTFDPSVAGPGEHTITYSVSAQQGAATEAAQAESAVVVNVVGASLSLSSTPATCSDIDGSATVTPSGGTPPFMFVWSNSVTSATNANLAAGSYAVTVTDGAGCTTQGMVDVSSVTLDVTAGVSTTSASCAGSDGSATVTPSTGTAPYVYAWSPGGQTDATASGLAAGMYTVVVTDAHGCQGTSEADVGGPSSCGSPDAGTTDMGVLADAGTGVHDAGTELDAGSVTDVGVARDLGAAPDAGVAGGGGCAVGGNDAHQGGMWLALVCLVSGVTRSRRQRHRRARV